MVYDTNRLLVSRVTFHMDGGLEPSLQNRYDAVCVVCIKGTMDKPCKACETTHLLCKFGLLVGCRTGQGDHHPPTAGAAGGGQGLHWVGAGLPADAIGLGVWRRDALEVEVHVQGWGLILHLDDCSIRKGSMTCACAAKPPGFSPGIEKGILFGIDDCIKIRMGLASAADRFLGL